MMLQSTTTKTRQKLPAKKKNSERWPKNQRLSEPWNHVIDDFNAKSTAIRRLVGEIVKVSEFPRDPDLTTAVQRELKIHWLKHARDLITAQMPITQKRPAKRPGERRADGARIRGLREAIYPQLTQARFAVLAGIDERSYQRIEAGAPTTLQNMEAVAGVLNRELKTKLLALSLYEDPGPFILPVVVDKRAGGNVTAKTGNYFGGNFGEGRSKMSVNERILE